MSRKKMKKANKLLQTAVFVCAVLLILTLSVTPVQAYFHAKAEQEIGIQLGSWWDGSKLSFEKAGETEPKTNCSPVNLTFSIRNSGFGMIGSTGYRIFKDGELAEEGSLSIIGENETGHLSIRTDKAGVYYAEADQRPGFQGMNETVRTESEKVTVAECPPPKKEEKKKPDSKVPSKETNKENADKPDLEEKPKPENDLPAANSDEKNESEVLQTNPPISEEKEERN
ncbi:hypothetical protein CEF21_15320 [Bacillus sp. FJAT-42376]|uniref:hypothetical protein n=1 Tax=Bacillus sp. FJAT-42376 TaxID=2014076 RepID=UPI000F4F9B89|nr:hypothetical protein [Bacillus sp. FJAT-42376]AZB43563.1 hypothetical protein CEF21_15320 [Bacillus sp. FJAT-42376]